MEFIPFIQSDNNYQLYVPLTGDSGTATYVINARWNSRDAAWYIDLYEDDLTPIAVGLKLVLGMRLGHSMQYKTFFQEHFLQLVDTSGERRDAAFDDLGGRVKLLHMSMSEFKGG